MAISQQSFIDKCNEIHNQKYGYSKTVYNNMNSHIIITCSIHGDFSQLAKSHSRGSGCRKCANEKARKKLAMTPDQFIELAIKKYSNNYSYDKLEYINNSTKVKIKCNSHNSYFYKRPADFLRGFGCPKCLKFKRLTKSEIIEKFKASHDNRYGYSFVVFKTMKEPVKIVCLIHGEFSQSPESHIGGSGCPKCAIDNSKETTDHFKELAKAAHGKYEYSKSIYDGRDIKIEIICADHGSFWQTPNAHYAGRGCPECANKARSKSNSSDLIQFIRSAMIIHGDKFKYDSVKYTNNTSEISIYCTMHNINFSQTPMSHLKGSECPKCNIEKMSKSKQSNSNEFIIKAQRVHGDLYDYSELVYKDCVNKVKIKCLTHGIFEQLPGNHVNARHGCPKCSHVISKAELEIVEFIRSISNNIDIITSDVDVLDGLELDILLPSKSIAIEYDGIYWHSEGQGKHKNYHLYKTEKCLEQNIKLFHIFENEWIDPIKRNIWKSMISNAIGCSNIERARKCKVVELSSSESNDFFNMNHLQGQGYGETLSYALLNNNGDIMAAMSFANPRYTREYDFELLRMCNRIGYTVTGGFSKLLCYFKRHNSGSLISYANKRFSNGMIYDKLGFEYMHTSSPGYWYHLKGSVKLMHRSSFQKGMLVNKLKTFDENKTEYENMVINGYDRIWDCGNGVYSIT